MLAAGIAIGFLVRPLTKSDVANGSGVVDLNEGAAALDAGNIVDPMAAASPSPIPTPTLDPAAVARDQARAAKLGAELMRRVGARFVGLDVRYNMFFDTPKPFGASLCRVNVYSIPENIARSSKPTRDQDFLADDLTSATRYAIWTSPSRPNPSDADGRKACAGYRDFSHTFSADDATFSAERSALIFEVLLSIVRGETKAPFPLNCQVVYSPKEIKTCDARAVLQRFALNDLTQVRDESKDEGVGARYSQTLFLRTRGKTDIAIWVEGVEQAGPISAEAKGIKRATVTIDRECGG